MALAVLLESLESKSGLFQQSRLGQASPVYQLKRQVTIESKERFMQYGPTGKRNKWDSVTPKSILGVPACNFDLNRGQKKCVIKQYCFQCGPAHH